MSRLGTLELRLHQAQSLAGWKDGLTSLRHSQAVPTLNVQLGLRWTPPTCNRAQFIVGYVYEHWWSLGKVDASALVFPLQIGNRNVPKIMGFADEVMKESHETA